MRSSDEIADLIKSSIWPTPSVSDQQEIFLSRWMVMESQTGDRHFVGYNMVGQEGRVSTPIISFDPITSKGVTRSGRVYQLYGGPGYDRDGSWVWSLWSRRNKIEGTDVTEEFYNLISSAPRDGSVSQSE